MRKRIDLRDWNLGDWTEKLAKSTKLTTNKLDAGGWELTVDIEESVLEAAAREIATEAIEAFLSTENGSCISLDIDARGFLLGCEELKEPRRFTWDQIWFAINAEPAPILEVLNALIARFSAARDSLKDRGDEIKRGEIMTLGDTIGDEEQN